MSQGHSEGVPAGVVILVVLAIVLGVITSAGLFHWNAVTGYPEHEGLKSLPFIE